MKKLKLFLSICTLCLCFAVLCIGIYAAQTVTYTISGTISYTVEDVFAKINTKVFKVVGQQDVSTMKTNVNTLATTAFSNIDTNTYIEDTKNTIEEYDTTSSNTASRTVAITIDSTYKTYYIVINIANLADRAINAMLTDTTTYTNLNTSSKIIQNGIAKGETKNLVVAFSLADKKVGIDSLAMNYSIEVGYTEYKIAFGNVMLKNDETNKYWYVELGQKSSTDTTKLKWRYVGDYSTSSDGTETFTRYDYSTTTPTTVGSGSVFVQETATTYGNCYWGKRDSCYNYFESSYIRTNRLKDGTGLSLTAEEKEYLTEGYIKARTLPDLDWSFVSYEESFTYPYTDTSHEALTSEDKGSDYFWLMSVKEVYTFFKNDFEILSEDFRACYEELVWSPSGTALGYWLRTPSRLLYPNSPYSDDEEVMVNVVTMGGGFWCRFANTQKTFYLRAAFQLA